MSFSVTFVGKPDAVKRKLAEQSGQLSGQSKAEFDAVRPALETILDQNVGNGVVRLDASGHASFDGETKTYGQCTVSVSVLGQIAE
jgi:hypothetical protein